MQNAKNITRYDNVAIGLHWLVALGVLIMIGLGWYMTGIPKGTPARAVFYQYAQIDRRYAGRYHSDPRLLAMGSIRPLRCRPARQAGWSTLPNSVTRFCMRCSCSCPRSGSSPRISASTVLRYFGLFKIGPFFAENKTLYDLFQGFHDAAAAVLVAVIAIHVAAALKHLLLDKDGVFYRMLPGGRAS
jgi:cytochrome b561